MVQKCKDKADEVTAPSSESFLDRARKAHQFTRQVGRGLF